MIKKTGSTDFLVCIILSFIIVLVTLSGTGAEGELMESEELCFESIGKGILLDNTDYNEMNHPYIFHISSRESWLSLNHLFHF